MRTRSKLALMGLGATILMAFVVSTASARNLSISNQNLRVTFNNLELGIEGFATTTCHVTLEGSLHSRTIAKVLESLIGYITRVTTGNCNAGVTILRTLPWHVRYRGFSGTLPNITLLFIRNMNTTFNVEPGAFINCLATANIDSRLIRSTATGELTGAEIPTTEVPLRGGGGFGCPASVGFFRSGGNGSVMLLGATTRITVTLI